MKRFGDRVRHLRRAKGLGQRAFAEMLGISHTVANPALPEDDFDAAVRIAQAEFDQHHEFNNGKVR